MSGIQISLHRLSLLRQEGWSGGEERWGAGWKGGKQKDSLYFPLNEFSNRVASSPANSLRKTKKRLNAEKVLG